MADLTTPATPFFFATMGLEHWYLKRRRGDGPPTAGDYERRDTIASLAMGTASLFAPMLLRKAFRPVTPGRGRWGAALVVGAIGAAAATTVADVLAQRTADGLPEAGALPDPAARATAGRADAAATATPDNGVAPATANGVAPAAGNGVGPATGAVRTFEDGKASLGRTRRRRLARRARRFASTTGAAAVTAGVSAACLGWVNATLANRMWERRGKRHDLGTGVLVTAGAILAWDFIYYLNHRLSHESRLMWAMHVVHHSSEHYNLSTALRQPVADTFTLSIPYSAMCLLGVRPSVLETARGVNLLYQYWIHTETIPKLGRFEEVFNTPSHHRVHHGSNRRYLDRNHGSILIIWDRLFGTFQRELDEEPVVYGLTKNIDTFNLARIATHEHADIISDVAASDNWSDRLGFVFRGPGWAYDRHARALAVTSGV